MKPLITALVSALISFPAAFFFISLVSGVEPIPDPFKAIFSNLDSRTGSLILLGFFLFLLPAFLMNFLTIKRGIRAGKGVMAYPLNLILAIAISGLILCILGSIVVDQYPCWMGVPNFD